MDLDLLKRYSFIAGVIIFTGCGSTNQSITQNSKQNIPKWIDDPSLNGKYKTAVSSCYKNTNNYNMKKVKKILIMKLKSIYSSMKNTTVESKYTKNNSDFKRESHQSSNRSYSKDFNILNKYKYNNEYCMHIDFNN